MVHYLTADDVTEIHDALVEFFAQSEDPIEPPGPRDISLLESAVTRPQTGLGNVDKYRSIPAKAAALMHSLVHNHPFHNGNKRTAVVATLAFLEHNDRWLRVSDSNLFSFVLDVARHSLLEVVLNGSGGSRADQEVDAMTRWIDARDRPIRRDFSPMTRQEFLDAVERAGGSCRRTSSGGSWVARGRQTGQQIRFSNSTRILDGNVVRNYFTRLGLVGGVDADELRRGLDAKGNMLREFREVIRGLATFDRFGE